MAGQHCPEAAAKLSRMARARHHATVGDLPGRGRRDRDSATRRRRRSAAPEVVYQASWHPSPGILAVSWAVSRSIGGDLAPGRVAWPTCRLVIPGARGWAACPASALRRCAPGPAARLRGARRGRQSWLVHVRRRSAFARRRGRGTGPLRRSEAAWVARLPDVRRPESGCRSARTRRACECCPRRKCWKHCAIGAVPWWRSPGARGGPLWSPADVRSRRAGVRHVALSVCDSCWRHWPRYSRVAECPGLLHAWMLWPA